MFLVRGYGKQEGRTAHYKGVQTAVSGGVQFCGFTSFTTLVPAPWLWLILEANEE